MRLCENRELAICAARSSSEGKAGALASPGRWRWMQDTAYVSSGQEANFYGIDLGAKGAELEWCNGMLVPIRLRVGQRLRQVFKELSDWFPSFRDRAVDPRAEW